MLHPERVVRRTELLEKVWDLHFDPMSNVVDVHVGHLRRKLDEAGERHVVRAGVVVVAGGALIGTFR